MTKSVLVWGAIGSVATILYRFYTQQPGRVSDEIRWLIARPIVGVIMGALTYIAVLSGLFVFGATAGTDASAETARPQLLWLLSFLAGFSDRFFEAVLALGIGQISKPEEKEPAES